MKARDGKGAPGAPEAGGYVDSRFTIRCEELGQRLVNCSVAQRGGGASSREVR